MKFVIVKVLSISTMIDSLLLLLDGFLCGCKARVQRHREIIRYVSFPYVCFGLWEYQIVTICGSIVKLLLS